MQISGAAAPIRRPHANSAETALNGFNPPRSGYNQINLIYNVLAWLYMEEENRVTR